MKIWLFVVKEDGGRIDLLQQNCIWNVTTLCFFQIYWEKLFSKPRIYLKEVLPWKLLQRKLFSLKPFLTQG